MINSNIIAPLIEKVTMNKDKVTSSVLLTYKKSDDNFVPDQNYVTALSTPLPYSVFNKFNGSVKDPHYNPDPESTYDAYDDFGNPTQITSKGKITTCYIWGYNKEYPIAKIENATYATGRPNTITANQQTLINDAVAASINETTALTESALIAKLQLLRNGFPEAMVTTYTYDPLIGVTSITDSKGYIIYYTYDSFSRLKTIKDAQGNLLSENQYNYKQ
jgi:YD repeat-containing protein